MNDIILLPIGSYEYHGELLPYDTDSIIATKVAESIAKLLDNSTVLPTVNYGMSFEHIDFPLTVSINTNTYHDFLINILESIAKPGQFVVLVNAHGGNSHMMSVVEADYNYRHTESKIYHQPIYNDAVYNTSRDLLGEFDSHAGSVEASLIAYYNKVSEKRKIIDKRFIKPLPSALRFFRNIEIGPTGVIKSTDTINIDPDAGEKIHQEIVNEIVNGINSILPKISKQINNVKLYKK